jgi:hypothetical protein
MTLDPKVGYSDNSSVNLARSWTWNEKTSRSSARGKMTEWGTEVMSVLEVMTSFRDDHIWSVSSPEREYSLTGGGFGVDDRVNG